MGALTHLTMAEALDGLADTGGHGFRGSRAVQGDVGARFVEIGDGLPGVADDQRQRAKAAATSSSVAKSPASVWRTPFSMWAICQRWKPK